MMARERAVAAVATVLVIALGLFSRRFPIGIALWDKSLGDILYAVMVYTIAIFVRPNAPASRLGAITFAICLAIELFKLTGVPAQAPRALRIVLGTTFAWHNVVCYAVGALLAGGVHQFARSRRVVD